MSNLDKIGLLAIRTRTHIMGVLPGFRKSVWN